MKRMLINATQAEERRLAIVDGQKLLDYEIEIEGREQRKGNIYKAVVTRVEPSLEACFVDYGEDRHGFLPFKEISRNHFQGTVAPSQARINDVIKEGQELLIQVEKEERGNKGAALTTFVSLAGRYVVLMPNNPRGGGVSRRIEGEDRQELKAALDQLEYPNGMSIIARTAGIGRAAPELQWDLNYLLKLWNAIDGAAQGGKGAFLIYQESSLVIRAIRDYFNSDIGEILIDTDDIFEQAHQFMAHVMPEHEHRVKRYRDDAPLFSRFQIEHQIETAYSRTVQLPSGGAIVIDQTEALVAVDVNSARAIKGGDIEETATRTNLEAADEVARQARLRDLGGLIVIDFIDMDESKNRREVENRLRDALRQDRARVQFGAISKFGLLEMSRQRLKPTLSEGASIPCPRCGGSGHIRDTESSALQILRVIQEESLKDSTSAVLVQVPVEVASFLLNEKRTEITKIELKQRINVLLVPNKSLDTPNYKLERLKHDDARLDNLDASYKMAEEADDVASFTRRSQERTNKQEPLIKGVLPDGPAPMAVPKPVAPATQVAPAPVATPVPPVATPVPAGKGFFGWLKSLFGSDEAAAPAPARTHAAAPAAASTEARETKRDSRGGRGGRGGSDSRGGRDGGRSARGEGRGDSRTVEGRSDTREPRAEVRGEPRGDGRNEGRGEGRGEGRSSSEGRSGERRGDNRSEGRIDGRNETRGEERNGSRRDARQVAPVDAGALGSSPAAEGGEMGERRERRSRNDGRRRSGAVEQADGSAPQAQLENGNVPLQGVDNTTEDVQAQPTSDAPDREASGEPRAPRERRGGRDRNSRDRRERAPRDETAGSADAAAADTAPVRVPDESADATPVRSSYFVRPAAEEHNEPDAVSTPAALETAAASVSVVSEPEPASATPVAPAVSVVPVVPVVQVVQVVQVVAVMPVASVAAHPAQPVQVPQAVVPVAPVPALPIVGDFVLPIEEMNQVAKASGLEWVNSNAEKVAQVQAAIAAEPGAIHLPRKPKPVVAMEDGPLVLVETRKDLRNMPLPFETPPAS
jgi:ribonuclease E